MNSETKKLCGEILQKLLKKYDRRNAKKVETNRRITLSPMEIYKDYHENDADIRRKEAINEAISVLGSERLVEVKRLKYSDEIKKIYMPEESVSRGREFLREKCGITPRNQIKEEAFQLLAYYEGGGALVKDYCALLRKYFDETAEEIELSRIEANLKMIDFLEGNRKTLYVREASVLVYGDSKWFQENNYEEICGILRNLLDIPQSDYEPADVILERFHIITNEQEILIKGHWKLQWKGFVMDISNLQGGIAISSADIPLIESVEVGTDKVMTVENKTSFHRMEDETFSYIYLGGYANRHQLAFLRKVIEDNSRLKYAHFGDIDAGGFLIHQNLCKATGKQFALYRMGISELAENKFATARKPLTANDVRRLSSLLEKEEYRETIEYMLANNCKMEQEIVSLFSDGGAKQCGS